jgi:uncharacterized RDD family membrane protein YckC
MQCRYCREWNEADERRCVRCGRRLQLAAPQAAPSYVTSFGTGTGAATAPALEALPGRRASAVERLDVPNYQPSLFRDASGAPKVIPILTLTPIRQRGREEREESAQSAKAARPRTRETSRRATDTSTGPAAQQALDFYGRTKLPEMEAVIYCDAPVALPAHRLIAAAFDASMVLIAVGVFPAVFSIAGGDVALTKDNVPFFVGVLTVLALFYRFLWCVANGDTPGMRFAGLKLVDFDGRVPDREQRGRRQLASFLSLVSAGLGLVWALVDEESLTWHDHISKTFPTIG